MPTREERSGWLSRWVGLLHEFASPSLQERVWVKASEPGYVSTHAELMCGYFDDLALSREGGVGVGYRSAVQEGLVTQAEADAVDHFHRIADCYATEYERDAVYLTDPAWQAVVSLAADAWHRLKEVAQPEVEALMRDREAAHGEIVRGRSWGKWGEDWLDVELTVLTAAEGGRERGVFTGYRPNWDIGNRTRAGEVTYNDGSVSVGGEPLGVEGSVWLDPGKSGLVRLFPHAPEFWYRVQPGQEIRMCEGARVVGKGVVRETGFTPLF